MGWLGRTVGLAEPVGWAVRMRCSLATLQNRTTHSQALFSSPSGRWRGAGKTLSEDVEKVKPSCNVGGNASWGNCSGKQVGSWLCHQGQVDTLHSREPLLHSREPNL